MFGIGGFIHFASAFVAIVLASW